MTGRLAEAGFRPQGTVWRTPAWHIRAFTIIVLCVAGVAAVVGAFLPGRPVPNDPPSALVAAALAVALVAAGQLARLRFRLGRGTVSVSWAEAAFILGYALAPPGWLPAATLAGAAGAWFLISWLGEHRPPTEIVHLAASLSLGAAGATLVTTAVAGAAAPSSARMQLALAAGALAYLTITFALAVTTLRLHRDAPIGQIILRVLHAKVPMLIGNVLVGLAALFVIDREPVWLVVCPPALWLLQRTYRYHLRAAEERRLWETFARAMTALPGGTEEAVAAAGLRGALDVFGARRVEIDVLRPDGEHHQYVREEPAQHIDASGLPGPVITRSMAVAGTPVGELTVWFAEPSLPVTREELAVSAYSDALAGALHDAVGRERLAELSARAFHDARHDPLTGLVNRSALLAGGDRLLRTLDRDRYVALLLLDLHRFREINGTLGHRAGDDVLRAVAERILAVARGNELVARLGNDEFAVLLPNVVALADSASPHDARAPLPQALRRARELVDQLASPMEIAGVRLAVESAVGVVVNRAGSTETAELVRQAALALDQAKELRVSVATYDSGRDANNTDHLALLAELHDALAVRDQLVLALQPAVDLETGTPTGVEALTRWQHPRRGLLSPAAFIDAIEDSELITPFTRYVLDLSLAAARDWAGQGFDLPVSVNLSARSLLDATLPSQVGELLRRHRVPPHRLVLEITESVAMSDQEIVDEVLAKLRDLGVQLSVDDFGTGFSTLSFVMRVDVDEIKIDRSFVTAMIENPAAEAAVRGTVELGERLGVRVVAEGVETVEQRTALIALGCTYAQGYHFSRPMPADRVVAALRQLSGAASTKVVPLRADGAV